MKAREHAALLERMSERLLEDFPQETWRKAFLGPGCEWIRFQTEGLTFLGSDSLEREWTPGEIEELAARHRGRVELCARRPVLVFPDARDALDAALLLQRTAGNMMRAALVTARCTTACFEVDGHPRRLSLGGHAALASATAATCAVGTIHLSAETYRALGVAMESRTQRARVTTERKDDVVTSAAITLSPAPRSDLGTFAELGLT